MSTIKASAVDDYERQLERDATPDLRAYQEVTTIEQFSDQQSLVVAETQLLERFVSPSSRYTLRIIELRSEAVLDSLLHEIKLLKKIGLHRTIMGLYLAFRHRQYIGLLQPPYAPLRDRIDLMNRFKKSGGQMAVIFKDPRLNNSKLAEDLSKSRGEQYLKEIGVFNRDAVIYVLRGVIAGLDYLNTKNFVHTQICSSAVFINEKCQVKLGSFLHCKRIGSRSWTFNGESTRLPPEAFLQQSEDATMQIKTNFDTWAIGLLVLEMATGRRMRYTRDEMAVLARKFINGTEAPPTLEETEPRTFVNGKQIYDPDITNFLKECFMVSAAQRCTPAQLLNHRFMKRPYKNKDAGQISIGIQPSAPIKWNKRRNLRIDMLVVHTAYAELKEDLLNHIRNAAQLVQEKKWCPDFHGNLEQGIRQNKYVAVDVSLAFIQDEDQDWSRDVLDVSNAESPASVKMPQTTMSKTPTPGGEQIRVKRNRFPGEHKDYQRCEMVFFLERGWSAHNRQLFMSILFARWYDRGLISFADLVRVIDELEDILTDHMLAAGPRQLSPYKHKRISTPPDSIAFITGLRRTLVDPISAGDPDTHRYNNIYIEVALTPELIEKKKLKMDQLRQGDPVQYPADVGPLYAAVTFHNLNMQRLQMLESMLMGEQRVKEWDFDPNQRQQDAKDPQTNLTTLLQLRRTNPNADVSSEIDWETSNKARRAKIWGDYTRDFMFRFAKYAVPFQLDHKTARQLYGSPASAARMSSVERLKSEVNDLELQVALTRSKQEEDTVQPFKYHDDVDARTNAIRRLQMDMRIQSLEDQIKAIKDERNQLMSSPAPPQSENIEQDVSRLPKHNQKK